MATDEDGSTAHIESEDALLRGLVVDPGHLSGSGSTVMRRLLKWSGGGVLVVITFAILFRGPLFRLCFHFQHLRGWYWRIYNRTCAPVIMEKGHRPWMGSCIDEARPPPPHPPNSPRAGPNDAFGRFAAHEPTASATLRFSSGYARSPFLKKGLSAGWRVRHVRGLLY